MLLHTRKISGLTLRALVLTIYATTPAIAAPATASTKATPTSLQPNVPYTDSNPNGVLWTAPVRGDVVLSGKGKEPRPSPERSGTGASILGPDNLPIDLQNADALAPPTTDNGQVLNFKWPFSMSHNKLKNGGWARQQNGMFAPDGAP